MGEDLSNEELRSTLQGKELVMEVYKDMTDGSFSCVDYDLRTEDALTLLAMATRYVAGVGKEKIGLTDDEIKYNIRDAVDAGLYNYEAEIHQ